MLDHVAQLSGKAFCCWLLPRGPGVGGGPKAMQNEVAEHRIRNPVGESLGEPVGFVDGEIECHRLEAEEAVWVWRNGRVPQTGSAISEFIGLVCRTKAARPHRLVEAAGVPNDAVRLK